MKNVSVEVAENPKKKPTKAKPQTKKKPAKAKPQTKKNPAKARSGINKRLSKTPTYTDGPRKGLAVALADGGGKDGPIAKSGKLRVTWAYVQGLKKTKSGGSRPVPKKTASKPKTKPASKGRAAGSKPKKRPATSGNPKPKSKSKNSFKGLPRWTSGPKRGQIIPKQMGGGRDGWRAQRGKSAWAWEARRNAASKPKKKGSTPAKKKGGTQVAKNPRSIMKAFVQMRASGVGRLLLFVIFGWLAQRFAREVGTFIMDLLKWYPEGRGEHLIVRNVTGGAMQALLFPWAWRMPPTMGEQTLVKYENRQSFWLGSMAGFMLGLVEDVVTMLRPKNGTSSDAYNMVASFVRSGQQPSPYQPQLSMRNTATKGLMIEDAYASGDALDDAIERAAEEVGGGMTFVEEELNAMSALGNAASDAEDAISDALSDIIDSDTGALGYSNGSMRNISLPQQMDDVVGDILSSHGSDNPMDEF